MSLSATINLKKLNETVKEIYKDNPRWLSHPEEYKNWLVEEEQADKAKSDQGAKAHFIQDQAELMDEESSLVNFLNVNSFILILRKNGIDCKISQTQPQTCGLWCIRPGWELAGYQFVTSMQVPVMPEWGLLHQEEHGLANGEAAIGWRQVLAMLIQKRVSTEAKLHKIFGEPVATKRTVRYRRKLQSIRSGRVGENA